MMQFQFTENPTLFLQGLQPNSISSHQTTTMINNFSPQPSSSSSTTTITKPCPTFPTQSKSSITNNLSGNTNCMEQLLVHCAQALENNDATPAQQILWVLNNIAPPDGDSNQRLTCAFLRALILRATRTPSCKFIYNNSMINNNSENYYKLSLIDLANFVHLTPWYRFGFTAANSIILDAIESNGVGNNVVVHIVDVSITQCMQIPTLIDLISTRFQSSPPVVRLTVGVIMEHVPPMFDSFSYDDVGFRLINFARSRGVVLEFKAVHTTHLDGFASIIDYVRSPRHHGQIIDNVGYTNEVTQEMLVVNCQMTLHYLQQDDEIDDNIIIPSMRTIFLKEMRSLEPDIVVIVEEDVDFTSGNLVGRLKSAFNYFWIPIDTLDTFLSKGNKQRECYEADICWKIENVISCEGGQRVERQEPRSRWVERMSEAGFQETGFGEETVVEVKGVVEEHGVGWGSKKYEEDLVLTWKGHNVVFASAWIPSS